MPKARKTKEPSGTLVLVAWVGAAAGLVLAAGYLFASLNAKAKSVQAKKSPLTMGPANLRLEDLAPDHYKKVLERRKQEREKAADGKGKP